MEEDTALQVGSTVRITSYSPFRGLGGVIQLVDEIPSVVGDFIEPFCFYLVRLEGTSIQTPVWFQREEIEPIFSVN